MKTYEVTAERSGKFWALRVPEIRRSTQARNVREVDEMARDLIAATTGTEPDSFDLQVTWKLPVEATAHFDRSASLREESVAAQQASAVEAQAGAKELQQAGLSMRDIGVVLGVSHQRAHQLVSGASVGKVSKAALKSAGKSRAGKVKA